MTRAGARTSSRRAQPPPPRQAGASCSDPFCALALNATQYVLNNLWNIETSGCHGAQAITVHAPPSWSTAFDWTRSDDWQVTSFAAAILGWHWGYRIPGTGLPLRILGAEPESRVLAELEFTMTPPDAPSCRYDVAFDCWAHASPTPTDADPKVEIMGWCACSQDYLGIGQPYLETRPVFDGLRWKVLPSSVGHQGDGQIDTVSFLIDGPNTWGGAFDVTGFVRWIVANRALFPPS